MKGLMMTSNRPKKPTRGSSDPTLREQILTQQIKDVCDSVARLREELIVAERADALQVRAIESLKGERDDAVRENSQLRHLLHESELDRERMRGYMDAVEDSRPPRMVEEAKERHFGRYTRMSQHELAHSSPLHQMEGRALRRPRAWFDK